MGIRKKTSFKIRKPKQQNDIKMKFLFSFLLLIALMATSEAFFLGGSDEETTTTAQPEPVGDDDNNDDDNDDEDEDDNHDDDEDDDGVSNEDLAKLLHKLLPPTPRSFSPFAPPLGLVPAIATPPFSLPSPPPYSTPLPRPLSSQSWPPTGTSRGRGGMVNS